VHYFLLDVHMFMRRVAGHLYGLEKFWAFLKYSRREVPINWQIKTWLSKFMRLEDFRGTANRVCFIFQIFLEMLQADEVKSCLLVYSNCV